MERSYIALCLRNGGGGADVEVSMGVSPPSDDVRE
jgi:hypothetical protein